MAKVAEHHQRKYKQQTFPQHTSAESLPELLQGNESFELLQKATHDAIYDWDFASSRLYWNDNTAQMFRYRPEAINTDLNWWADKIHPDERELITGSLKKALQSDQRIWTAEYRFLRGDGSYCDVLDRGYIARDANNHPVRMIGAMIDITEKKLAQKKLLESEQMFRSIADTVPVMIWMTGLDMGITFLNKVWFDYTGMPPEQTIGQGWMKAFHPEDRDRVVSIYANAFRKQEKFSFEARKIHNSGNYRWVLANGVPRFNYAGLFSGYIGTCSDITDQKFAIEQMKESEERFRSMAEASPQMIWLIDADDRISYCNKAALDFVGKSREELMGLDYRHFAYPDDLATLPEIRQNAINTRTSYHFECRFRRWDGIYRWILVSAGPRYISDGFYQGIIGSGIDITERKEAEQILKESEQLFRSIADTVPTMIEMTDSQGRFEFINRAYLDFTGYSAPELIGLGPETAKWQKQFAADDLKQWLNDYLLRMKNQEPFMYEIRLKHYAGGFRWTVVYGVPRYDSLGNFVGYTKAYTDISQLKETESALLESESRFRDMANSAPFIIVLSDNATGFFHFNHAWRDYTGLDYASFWGRGWFKQVVHPEDQHDCLSRYLNAMRARQAVEGEFRVRRHDGEYRWVFGKSNPRFDAEGKLLGYISSWIDINEKKQYREELEQTVQKRTADLEAVNRELESFSYSVSHDLRAPLRGIDGMSRLVLKNYQDKLDPEGVRYLNLLRHEAQRMGELINEMLNLSRLTRGELHWSAVNLSDIASEISESLKQQDPSRNVTFKIKPGVIVQGDEHLLRAVLENLLGNAWKFTAKHPTALIQFGTVRQKGQLVYFVKDDGAGFDMKYANQLFGAFQRLHTTEEFPGTGIGLATVQRIIHRHSGRVWARGKVEKGAQVYFTLGEKYEPAS